MAKNNGILRTIIDLVVRLLTQSRSTSQPGSASSSRSRPRAKLTPQPHNTSPKQAPRPSGGPTVIDRDESRGQHGKTRTIEVAPPASGKLTISYNPAQDGEPDAGEVIWTWVPYEENDGRGKDRPVLIIGRAGGDRVYAVRLTSKSHDGNRDFLSIGSGPWDPKGRPSWVDIDQVYTVHVDGMRREAAALDLKRFSVVADALVRRYGWKVAGA